VKIEKKELIFFAKFFGIFLGLEYLIITLDFSPFQEFIATSQAAILGITSVGNLIFVKNGAFQIVPSCIGLVSGSVLAAAVFSLKKPELKQKILVFLSGFVLLIILNYFRVLLVIWTGNEFGLEIAEYVHVATWFTTAIFVLGLWYYFTKKITGVKNFSGFL